MAVLMLLFLFLFLFLSLSRRDIHYSYPDETLTIPRYHDPDHEIEEHF